MPTQFIYFPVHNRSEKRSNVYRSVFAPSTGRVSSYDIDTEYSPKSYFKQSLKNKSYYDYNPLYYNDTYLDYTPRGYYSLKASDRYSPSDSYERNIKFRPVEKETLDYEPKLRSVFKPQIVVTSNYYVLDSYYNFLVRLLKVLR